MDYQRPLNKAMIAGTIRHATHDAMIKIKKHCSESARRFKHEDVHNLFRDEYLIMLRNAVMKYTKQLEETMSDQEAVFLKAWTTIQKVAEFGQ